MSATVDEADETLMGRALALAEQGRGWVEPNPLVGAVIARDGQIVGEGWHQRFGQEHAEIKALTEAGDAARGATLYVTLEPCCHHGKTPPCTEAILRAGVRRVVAAMMDPFPQVAGKGLEALRAAKLQVRAGVREAEAQELNAPYLKLLSTGRPYVIAKWAMTLDGKIATRSGDARWVSGKAARQRVHELRGRMDAIVVGISTVLADDPLLTARPPGPRNPCRVVLDTRLRLPQGSQLVQTAGSAPVLVIHGPNADHDARRALEAAGCKCFSVPVLDGRLSVAAILDELGRRRWTNLLIEGGSAVLGSFFDAAAIDDVWVFIAPKLAGGVAKSPIGGVGIERMTDALRVQNWSIERVGDDVLVRGRLTDRDSARQTAQESGAGLHVRDRVRARAAFDC